ncbi:UNVERIFIED_CONTAM: hypothetical protein FKN15_035474 [Acipenser sinensis]
MDLKALIEKINRNTTAQQEQCRKWRQKLGLPDPEPTELDLLLQRWEQAGGTPLTPAPEPRGEEPLLPEPRGEELPLPEPRGEEPPLPDPRGEEPPLAEPRGEEPSLAEPRGEEPPLPDPRGEEPPLAEPRGEEPPWPEPPVEVKGEDVPPPLQASPVLPREVLCPGSVDTGLECPDLPPLDLAPRSQYSQAQSPAWSLAPLPLEFQTSLRRRKTSLRKRQTSPALPLLIAPFPLPTSPLPWNPRRRCAGPQPRASAYQSMLPVTGLRCGRPGQAVWVPPRRS